MGEMLVRHEPATASAVRRQLALELEYHGVRPDVVEDITLVASELVGNAIRHAGGDESDSWAVTWVVQPNEILISVEDPSSEMPIRAVRPPRRRTAADWRSSRRSRATGASNYRPRQTGLGEGQSRRLIVLQSGWPRATPSRRQTAHHS